MTTEDKNKSEAKELFEKIPIENSPFVVIRQSDNGKCFAVFGKYKITEDMSNVEECIKVATEITWDRMIQVMTLVNDMMSDINELKLKLINK